MARIVRRCSSHRNQLIRATFMILILAPLSGAISDDEMYAHLPRLEQVKAYFVEHRASLKTLFELFATDNRVNWLECGGNGQYRITPVSHVADFTPEPTQARLFRESCKALNTRLVQRVDSGISVIWNDIEVGNTRFRIELYGADSSIEDSCLDHQFERPISSCMLMLDSPWRIRYIGIVDRT